MANQAEQSAARDSFPGSWLADLTSLRRLLNENAGAIPPVLRTLSISHAEETKLVAAYRSALEKLAAGDLRSALHSLDALEQSSAELAEPCLWRALLALSQRGHRAECRRLAEEAERRWRLWGTSWDKRLSLPQWLQIAQALQKAQAEPPEFMSADARCLLLWADRASGREPSRSLVEEALPVTRGSAAVRLRTFLETISRASDSVRLNVYPLPNGPAWYEPNEFAITKALEDSFPAVREEVLALDDHAFHPESEKIRRNGAWEVCLFYERGRKNVEKCARCPTITRIVEEHDTVRTLAGLIYISRMAPQTHVAAHRGPTNLRVRCHLGIQIPDGDCAIRVGSETRRWAEGKCLVFDDFYEHEAWNHTAAERIVLIIDLWRPELGREEREFLTGLHRYALLQAESLQRYWSANAGSKMAKRKGYD